MSKPNSYRKDIQFLRGIAILLVILFHAYPGIFAFGYLGVDVFFVISGFVITPLILKIFTIDQSEKTNSWNLNLIHFYIRRFYRLSPAIGFATTILTFLIIFLGQPTDYQRFARQGIATLLLLGNFGAYRYSGDYFSPNQNPMVHTWSLSVEEQIYIAIPVILAICFFIFSKTHKYWVLVYLVLTTLSLLSFAFPSILKNLYSELGSNYGIVDFSFYSPIDRLWQFTVGGLGYYIQSKGIHFRRIKFYKITVLICVLLIFFIPKLNSKIEVVFATTLTCLILVTKSLKYSPRLIFKFILWLGDRSFSIYLFHMPLIYLATHSPLIRVDDEKLRFFLIAIALLGALALGSFSFRKIEIGFRTIGKNKHLRSKYLLRTFVLTLVIPMILLALLDKGSKNHFWGMDRNIMPPLAAWESDPKCKGMAFLETPCIFNNLSTQKNVLLIGDSHASHIAQAFVDASKVAGWNSFVWTKVGCNLQLKINNNGEISEGCLKQNLRILKWISRNKPDAVIVSQFVYANSSQNELRNALKELRAKIPNILLIENNPIFPDEKDFMIDRPFLMTPYDPPKFFSRISMQNKDQNASNALAIWAKNNKISTLNFESLFCNTSFCTRFGNEGWLYRDDDHFSISGASRTVPLLINYLENASS